MKRVLLVVGACLTVVLFVGNLVHLSNEKADQRVREMMQL
jgi:hypothetical protein